MSFRHFKHTSPIFNSSISPKPNPPSLFSNHGATSLSISLVTQKSVRWYVFSPSSHPLLQLLTFQLLPSTHWLSLFCSVICYLLYNIKHQSPCLQILPTHSHWVVYKKNGNLARSLRILKLFKDCPLPQEKIPHILI